MRYVTILAIALSLVSTGRGWAQNFTVKGVKIAYLDKGKGEPVVLVHGLFSSTLINWQLTGVVNELSKDHRVVSLDLPGHGFSDRPMNKEAYGEQLVDDVIALMDHLKIKKAHIVGYSLGGMITVKLMVKYPDRVISGTVGGMGYFEKGSILQKFWDGAGKGKDSAIGPPPVFLECIPQLAVTDKEIKKIDLPVTVLIGEKDICKPLYVDPLKKIRKDWPIVDIKDADHFTCIIRPQFRDEIGAWVRKNSK